MAQAQPAKHLLRALGIRPSALARLVGLPRDVLQRALDGEVLPTDELATAVSHYLRVDREALFRPEYRKRGQKMWRPRPCQRCSTVFAPTSGHNMFCPACRFARRAG